mgnify:CR=1 FL=1
MKSTHGEIHIDHSVTCPHCLEYLSESTDQEWWNNNITDQLPNEEAYRDKYIATCPECKQEFLIDGFIY